MARTSTSTGADDAAVGTSGSGGGVGAGADTGGEDVDAFIDAIVDAGVGLAEQDTISSFASLPSQASVPDQNSTIPSPDANRNQSVANVRTIDGQNIKIRDLNTEDSPKQQRKAQNTTLSYASAGAGTSVSNIHKTDNSQTIPEEALGRLSSSGDDWRRSMNSIPTVPEKIPPSDKLSWKISQSSTDNISPPVDNRVSAGADKPVSMSLTRKPDKSILRWYPNPGARMSKVRYISD